MPLDFDHPISYKNGPIDLAQHQSDIQAIEEEMNKLRVADINAGGDASQFSKLANMIGMMIGNVQCAISPRSNEEILENIRHHLNDNSGEVLGKDRLMDYYKSFGGDPNKL